MDRKPVAPLMIEHRLIQRMVDLVSLEQEQLRDRHKADTSFLEDMVDLFRTYADKWHHGKEEDILFKALENKTIKREHEGIMQDLLEDHRTGRKLISRVEELTGPAGQGDEGALNQMAQTLDDIVRLYTGHIKAEDGKFFLPVLDYFDGREQEEMLEKMDAFDAETDHQRYTGKVEQLEKSGENEA